MPRRNLIKSSEYFYHVTTRSNHKAWFLLNLDEVWNISEQSMKVATSKCDVEVAQFVLMNNHYHLLIRTPNMDLDKFMYYFNRSFSEKLRKQTGQINRMFGSRYKASLVDSKNYLKIVYKYIYQNPVTANLVFNCEDYPYSTLNYKVKNKKWIIDVIDIFKFDKNFLEDINMKFSNISRLQVKSGLSKTRFTPAMPKCVK